MSRQSNVSPMRGDDRFRGLVAKLCAEWHCRRVIFADDCGFSEPHLRRILKEPETMRLSDLRGIIDAYEITDDEILAVVKGDR